MQDKQGIPVSRPVTTLLRLTSYHALYVDLAQREGLPLATLDKGLRAAAVQAGVALLK